MRCTLCLKRWEHTLTIKRGWCSADEYDRVLEVWQRMAKEAATGSEVRPNTETCNTVIAAAACAGDLEAACDAYNYLIRHNLPVDVVRAAPALPEIHPGCFLFFSLCAEQNFAMRARAAHKAS